MPINPNKELNTFEVYCPYKNESRQVKSTGLVSAISVCVTEFNEFKSDFEVHDVVFCRVEHNPVFLMYSVSPGGLVSKYQARIHMNFITKYIELLEEPSDKPTVNFKGHLTDIPQEFNYKKKAAV